MRLAPQSHRAYTYTVTVGPAAGPVSLDTFKQHINVSNNLTDSLLQIYLDAAVSFAERYTGKYLITRTFQTFRDFFPNARQHEGYYSYGRVPAGSSSFFERTACNVGFELQRSPLQTVNSITYIDNDNVVQTVDSNIYYFTVEEDYSEVLIVDGNEWPEDAKSQLQSITIDFNVGYGNDESEIDACWKIPIMEHGAMLWANRGDCSDSGCMSALPSAAKAFYDTKRIIDF